MKKKSYKSKKTQQKNRERILVGGLAGLLVLALLLGTLESMIGVGGAGYSVTEDGHVHAADGTHLGTVEELFGESGTGNIITEDGHDHAAE